MVVRMDRFHTMQVFVEVAKQQSFVAASEILGLSAPATTRSIADLENRLGVKLFNRTTRVVRLTESGEKFLHDTKQILERLAEAENATQGIYTKPSGTLTITAPVLFGEKHIMPIVNEYLALHPNVSVKAIFYDRITNLLEEEFDVAIRIGHLKDSSLYATPVGSVRRIVCGSPDYFRRHGTPNFPHELTEHQVIFPANYASASAWQFLNKGKKEQVKLTPRLYCNQNASALKATITGCGITRLMSYQIGEELNNGALTSILTAYEEEPLPVSIVRVEGRRANAKIRLFIDLATERLKSNPFINKKNESMCS